MLHELRCKFNQYHFFSRRKKNPFHFSHIESYYDNLYKETCNDIRSAHISYGGY